MTRTSIIAVSWNGEAYLGHCLTSILAEAGSDDEVIVVDNNSTDGSAALVRECFPQAHLIENERNLGFAGGCNVGLRAARGEYLVLVNQDITVQKGWLEALLSALAQPEAGIVGCKLLYPDGTIQHAGGFISYPLAHPGHYGYREPDEGQCDEQREVDYVIGAALGLKRQVLNDVGFFDEGFFPAFYEETDLCFRARAAGYSVIYTPGAVGTHYETTTIDRQSTDYHRWMNRGRLRFALKHYTAEQFHEEFVPAERAWLAEVSDLAIRQGLRLAYLDTVLGLRDIPRTGALAEMGSEESTAEALLGLREALSPSAGLTKATIGNFLVEPPWRIHESKIPILGPVLARLRGLWDSVWRLQEKLAVVQEILASLDRETTESRRAQAEAMYNLQEKADRLESRVGILEEASSDAAEER
jgi:GT2 family glycosyltransferase